MVDIFQDQDFVRKQFPVQAVQVTPLNIQQLAEACGGKLMDDGEKEGNFSRNYIKVPVRNPLNDDQTKARVGHWIVKQGRAFKVYSDKAFRQVFESKTGAPIPGGEKKPYKGKNRKPNNGPNPGQMPKKRTEGPRKEGVPEIGDKMVGQSHTGLTSSQQLVEGTKDVDKRVNSGAAPAEIIEHEDNGERILQTSFGKTPKVVSVKVDGADAIQAAADKISNLTLDGASAEEINKAVQESIGVIDEIKVTTEPKPITLDELNDQAGDPRSAQEIMMEDQTPGEKFRGEA